MCDTSWVDPPDCVVFKGREWPTYVPEHGVRKVGYLNNLEDAIERWNHVVSTSDGFEVLYDELELEFCDTPDCKIYWIMKRAKMLKEKVR